MPELRFATPLQTRLHSLVRDTRGNACQHRARSGTEPAYPTRAMCPATSLLIVDDNASLGNAYESLLEEHGYEVMTASSGDEAVSLCEEAPVNVELAIVDLKMPGLDGPATIAALQGCAPQLKVIAMSGQILSPYFARLADLGVRHFLPKPFGIESLLDAIRDLSGSLAG